MATTTADETAASTISRDPRRLPVAVSRVERPLSACTEKLHSAGNAPCSPLLELEPRITLAGPPPRTMRSGGIRAERRPHRAVATAGSEAPHPLRRRRAATGDAHA